MGEQELLEYLLKEIEKCGFEIFDSELFTLPAAVNIDNKMMIYNPKEASPFRVAHELIHIINKDNHRGGYCDSINPQEVRANREAVLLLWEIFEANGGSYDYFNVFVDITESPFDLAFSIISKVYAEMNEAINEIFEDEIQVSVNKQEMHDYIVDYIGYFDVIESVNIYEFLDRYHLSYTFSEMAEREFRILLGTA